jgi:hypothetical protein
VATEAAWLNGKMKNYLERVKKLLTGIGLLMEGLELFRGHMKSNRHWNPLSCERG